MANPFNPLDWVHSAQNWFSRTEKSSGFRPYLIFLLILVGFVVVLLGAFPNSDVTKQFSVPMLFLSFLAFIILYFIKAFRDPGFCRSEKHIENVKRIELMGQKDEPTPQIIDVDDEVGVSKESVKKIPREDAEVNR